MKIILLCGNKSNQNALAVKVARDFDLVGIVKEERKEKHPATIPYLFSKVVDRFLFYKIGSSWHAMLAHYKKEYPETGNPISLTTENINSTEVVAFIEKLQPDLIMVSGTSLIKNKLLDLKLPKGIINLHTGLSPYVKGGPNCTNWCIANNTVHLIGNTIMWIDKGIDSGNIISSDTVRFNGMESLAEIHIKVMEHAHQLYLNVLHCLKKNPESCPSVKQAEIAKGELFLTRMWNFKAKLRFMFRLLFLKKAIRNTISKPSPVKLIQLPPLLSTGGLHRKS